MTTQDVAVEEEEEFEPLPPPVVTYILLGIMAILFVLMGLANGKQFTGFSEPVIDLFGAKINSRIYASKHVVQWWRFVSPVFLHGGLLHLAVNSYSLLLLGRQIEQLYGSRKYLLVFLIAGIAGVAASYRFSSAASLGASGAIFGLVGAGIVFPLRFRSLIPEAQRRQIVKQLVQVAVINLAIGFVAKNYVDNAAHIGGLLGGGVAALFLKPDALEVESPKRISTVFVNLLAAAAVVIMLTAGYQQYRWATGRWWWIKLPSGARILGPVQQFEGRWSSKTIPEFGITDAVHNPNIASQALGLLIREDLPARWIAVDGYHGRVLLLQNDRVTIEACVLLVPDVSLPAHGNRMVVIQMLSPTEKFTAAQKDFAAALKTFRVLHQPPPDLHPVPVPAAKPASKKPIG